VLLVPALDAAVLLAVAGVLATGVGGVLISKLNLQAFLNVPAGVSRFSRTKKVTVWVIVDTEKDGVLPKTANVLVAM
jgi:hypothetical protein